MSELVAGQQLDEYRIEALLGRGGMGRVYKAVDVNLGRTVALKVIDSRYQWDERYLHRFEMEAQAIARLEHPHIIRLYRYGVAWGRRYLAMQYVQGASLRYVLNSYREDGEFIPPEDVSRIFHEVSQALDYAHDRGVIHRDVTPANVLLDREGRALLSDFGIALLIEIGTRGEVFGSPHYIAPEQALSSRNSVPQSDLYSLGVILYQIFTGQLPFDAQQALDIANQHLNDQPPPPREKRPELSQAVEEVILKALAKDPAHRYGSCGALSAALDQALLGKVI